MEVLARKLHLTDSKEPSPLFLSHLLPAVAEAVRQFRSDILNDIYTDIIRPLGCDQVISISGNFNLQALYPISTRSRLRDLTCSSHLSMYH